MNEAKGPTPEMPDQFWRKIYVAVVITTVIVITALWAFGRYFR